MSKPINVEAQRVHKLLSETCGKDRSDQLLLDKVKVLALLNSDFFEEISKKELEELGKLITVKTVSARFRTASGSPYAWARPTRAELQTEQCRPWREDDSSWRWVPARGSQEDSHQDKEDNCQPREAFPSSHHAAQAKDHCWHALERVRWPQWVFQLDQRALVDQADDPTWGSELHQGAAPNPPVANSEAERDPRLEEGEPPKVRGGVKRAKGVAWVRDPNA